ncbi:MAG TPA: calcium/sodium antiporter [Kofleriaceae bacterium]|nr:calcium/sodium antiporter [Kofleriaceae bacterium]
MDILLDVGRLLFGGLVLYLGAEWLVKGSAGLARAFGVKPLVIGLTVVAYGTSAPELAVSSAAILNDSSDIVLGNVIGSCIANILLILGITAMISPPAVDGNLIRREIPVLLLSAAAVPLVLLDGEISRVEGTILLILALVFTIVTLTSSSTEAHVGSAEQAEESAEAGGAPRGEGKLRLIAITIVGLAMLVGGGDVFVDGAKGIALTVGMSERLVGLTIVAIGTSLPELAASVVAAMRGYSSLAVGNVIGSNIFNVFLILGVTSEIAPVEGDLSRMHVDIGFLLGSTVLAILFMRGSRIISRAEGVILLVAYGAFIVLASIGW